MGQEEYRDGGPMTEEEPVSKPESVDRRLGDEWQDWNGSSDTTQLEVDEKLGTFLVLSASAILLLIAAVELGWYLAKPRIEQFSLSLSQLLQWSAFVLAGVFAVLVGIEALLLFRFRKSLMPYVWAEKVFLSLLSKTVWLGAKFGISRDRVANSFIKAHNLMVRSHARELKTHTLLILVPRCLDKDSRRQVIERANGRAVQVVTAAGGEEARKAVRQYRPSLILAIACERDLISGIKDVAEKIPVLAVPNKRPEGPCKNTRVYLKDLDDVLKFIADHAEKGAEPLPEPAG
jgi:uncharacterized protein